MPLDPATLLALRDDDRLFAYDERDTMLYALAIGFGRDPLDGQELPFVFEGGGLRAVPTMAVVVARSELPRKLPINRPLMLHVGQSVVIHAPIPTAAELMADTRITRIIDKGEGKGALIYYETAARDARSAQPIFTIGGTLFARGDGGCGGSAEPVPQPHPVPQREADKIDRCATRPDQALLYRLTGDMNPLHADPTLAATAGFEKPILHGLCTYGMACRSIVKTACDHDPARIAAFEARFTSPVFPGDVIETEVWRDGNIVSFRCRVPDRGVTVLDNGRCVLTQA